MSTSADRAPVVFPSGGTPPDADGYPHYAAIGEANERFRSWYEGELAARRRVRQAVLEPGPRDSRAAVRARWAQRAGQVRTGLAECLGLSISSDPPEPAPARFEFGVPISAGGTERGLSARQTSLAATWVRVPASSWEDGDIQVLVLRPRAQERELCGLLLIPDAGPCLMGGESPETAARAWGCALAAAGMVVAIPRLPGYARFSSTQNKRRLLEGACVLGEIVFEAVQALQALAEQPGVAPGRVWVGGRGVGGLAAIMLGVLDQRVGGVLADAPVRWGVPSELQALIVPRSHPVTDLPELAALLAPRPLALVRPPEEGSLFDAPPADPQELARAAEPAYALSGAPDNLALLAAGEAQEAIRWMQSQGEQGLGEARPRSWVVQGERPARCYAVTGYDRAEDWQGAADSLRRAYRELAGLIEAPDPVSVQKQSETRLEDCTREEYHVRTGTYSYANLAFLRPHGPVKPRPTILCLPGSSSDVGRVEARYAHEVVAQGWNAAIVDARVALYPFHPGIAEERAMVSQSLHDLLCALDYLSAREDVDPERIGAMGLSQGGVHTWMLAAMDERVAAAVSVCGVCTYCSLPDENQALSPGAPSLTYLDSHSIYYYTAGVLRIADQQDLCALIAPRPFVMIGANHDNCFSLHGVRECARDLAYVYKLLGVERRFHYIEFEGPHSMPLHTRKAAYAFFRYYLHKEG